MCVCVCGGGWCERARVRDTGGGTKKGDRVTESKSQLNREM